MQTLDERTATLRVATFLASATGLLLLHFAGLPAFLQAIPLLGFIFFAFLIWRQDRIRQVLRLFHKRLELGRRQRACAELDWGNIPALPPVLVDKLPRYFSDLDLIQGHAVLRLVNQTVSTRGWARLLSYFDSNAIDAKEMLRRQKTVQEMARLQVLRRRFMVTEALWAGLIESDRIEDLLARPLHTPRAPWFFGLVFAAQAAFLGLFAWFALTAGSPYFMLAGIVLYLTYRRASREVRLLEAYAYGMSVDVSLGKFSALAEVAGRMSRAGGENLRALLAPFSGERNPRRILALTGRVVGCLGVRQNYILHMAVNLLFPWDFFWTLRLEKLRREIHDQMPTWLNTLAEVEVFLSLAEFCVAHPDYVFPETAEANEPALQAQGLAHPLIEASKRVGNDLVLSKEQRCLVITGSNMSGKSTFLRSIGVNVLLARSGTVVCARRLRLGPLQLATSLRLNDSLEEGLSSFYAEVRQLKRILEHAEAGKPVLYLIDEVFRGTNNRERLIGSRAYIRRLSATTAFGLVTTHDLELAQLASENPGIHNFHFKEDFEGDEMRFHYKLAPGPCPTTNALKVMELAGLPTK
ncbi:hypothetical protein K2X33_06465 [bacterium]|nr:hypothetical protein [bacterium]